MITKYDESFEIQKTMLTEPKPLRGLNLFMNVALISELVNIVSLVKYELLNAIVNQVSGRLGWPHILVCVCFSG